MRPPGDSHTLTLNSSRAEEARMRASLGMAAEDQAGRSDAGQGGRSPSPSPSVRRAYEPPDASRARLAALTSELKAEREERIAAQQALANAQQVIQRLQTQLAHAEMAAGRRGAASRTAGAAVCRSADTSALPGYTTRSRLGRHLAQEARPTARQAPRE